jgi:hypothetical protein
MQTIHFDPLSLEEFYELKSYFPMFILYLATDALNPFLLTLGLVLKTRCIYPLVDMTGVGLQSPEKRATNDSSAIRKNKIKSGSTYNIKNNQIIKVYMFGLMINHI